MKRMAPSPGGSVDIITMSRVWVSKGKADTSRVVRKLARTSTRQVTAPVEASAVMW